MAGEHSTVLGPATGTVVLMRRQCARPGCSAIATTTFTFDSRERTVWLDAPRDGAARAGELCARHARALGPPRGWHVVDRREIEHAPGAPPAAAGSADEPVPVVALAPLPTPAPPGPEPIDAPLATVGWHPKFERGDSLDGVLDATTPLLARAFDNVRAV
jgi:hypothetical protein